ncbi:hypothetical protein [Arthrobacter flavus]|uniref:Uncharacterized protein n=1 Tax=Arthrobacter flavus TaxID=95172 RepID=A0ABW4QBN7_9MICC
MKAQPVKKLSPLLALPIAALLLAGCVSNTEPSAEVTGSDSGSSPSATASASPAPSAEGSPSPAEAPDATESTSPAPDTEPSTAPASASEPTEDATSVAAPTEAPITETSEPPIPGLSGSYDDLELVSTWDGLRVVRHVGTTWNVVGSGYPPGAEIQMNFGPAQTDSSLIGYPLVYADANGNYTFQISLAPDLAPGDYGLMAIPTGLGFEESEAAKRFALIEVVSTWTP